VLETLGRSVASRDVSAADLISMAVSRIDRLDAPINAVVRTRPEEALAEADRIDERAARGERVGPLAGIPFLVKDVEDLEGAPTTFGSMLFAEARPAAADSLIPRRLRAAGAIPVGKSNTPEFACEGFTDNLLFGATRNPWNLERSPGGSSGGSGAAVAAGMVPFATATDGGGSIRIPAGFCGLVGLKPTNGLIARDPIPHWHDLSTCGPLATSVADLRLLLSIEAGPAPGDPTAIPSWDPGPPTAPARILAAPRWADWGPLPEEIGALFAGAVARFAAVVGVDVDELDPASIFRAGNPDLDWFTMCTAEHVQALGRAFVESNLERMSTPAATFMQDGLKVTIDEYLTARRRRFAYVRDLDDLLASDAVLIMPTNAAAGWTPDGSMPDAATPGVPPEVYNTAVQNITGHPAISLPAGMTDDGVPFGLQVTGPRYREDMLLDIAERWEQAYPWPAVAPGYEPFSV